MSLIYQKTCQYALYQNVSIMSKDSRINYKLRVSLIELLTDSIALNENVIIKYYWQKFATTQAVQWQMVFLQNGFLGVIHLSH